MEVITHREGEAFISPQSLHLQFDRKFARHNCNNNFADFNIGFFLFFSNLSMYWYFIYFCFSFW